MRTLVMGLVLCATTAWGQATLTAFASVGTAPSIEAPTPERSVAPLIEFSPAARSSAAIQVASERELSHRSRTKKWLLLSVAAHSGAALDAWTTRTNVTAGRTELNPVLRPFVNTNGLYPVMQIGPTLTDLVAWKLMKSQHHFLRKLWWVPQVASASISFTCSARNARAF
jgi:hypothetical protein